VRGYALAEAGIGAATVVTCISGLLSPLGGGVRRRDRGRAV